MLGKVQQEELILYIYKFTKILTPEKHIILLRQVSTTEVLMSFCSNGDNRLAMILLSCSPDTTSNLTNAFIYCALPKLCEWDPDEYLPGNSKPPIWSGSFCTIYINECLLHVSEVFHKVTSRSNSQNVSGGIEIAYCTPPSDGRTQRSENGSEPSCLSSRWNL